MSHQRFAALHSGGFSAQNMIRSTHIEISKNVHMKYVTRHYAKPLLGAGVYVHLVCNCCPYWVAVLLSVGWVLRVF